MLLAQLPALTSPAQSSGSAPPADTTGGVHLFGVRLFGFNAHNGTKLLLTIALIVIAVIVARVLHALLRYGLARTNPRVRFWFHQGVRAVVTVLALMMLLSVWVDQPGRLATVVGLATAGLAIALQKVVTSVAAYIVILRGKTFSVGDRIKMGGVRGDVIALDFIHTTIMEMGQPPGVMESEPPGMWVEARQYTGRIVTVTNDKIFDEAIYNYSRDFPYLFEEMRLPVSFKDDRNKAEQILLDVARKHTTKTAELSADAAAELRRRYFAVDMHEFEPRVYWRITDNWLELTVRFIAPTHGVRALKDAMSREILTALNEAKIGIASGTYEIVGVPTIPVRLLNDRPSPA